MSLPNNCNPKFNCLGHISSLSLAKIRSVDLGIIDTVKILMVQSHFVIFGILLYLILSVSLGRAQASRNHFFGGSPDFHKLWHGHNDCLLQKKSSDGIR